MLVGPDQSSRKTQGLYECAIAKKMLRAQKATEVPTSFTAFPFSLSMVDMPCALTSKEIGHTIYLTRYMKPGIVSVMLSLLLLSHCVHASLSSNAHLISRLEDLRATQENSGNRPGRFEGKLSSIVAELGPVDDVASSSSDKFISLGNFANDFMKLDSTLSYKDAQRLEAFYDAIRVAYITPDEDTAATAALKIFDEILNDFSDEQKFESPAQSVAPADISPADDPLTMAKAKRFDEILQILKQISDDKADSLKVFTDDFNSDRFNRLVNDACQIYADPSQDKIGKFDDKLSQIASYLDIDLSAAADKVWYMNGARASAEHWAPIFMKQDNTLDYKDAVKLGVFMNVVIGDPVRFENDPAATAASKFFSKILDDDFNERAIHVLPNQDIKDALKSNPADVIFDHAEQAPAGTHDQEKTTAVFALADRISISRSASSSDKTFFAFHCDGCFQPLADYLDSLADKFNIFQLRHGTAARFALPGTIIGLKSLGGAIIGGVATKNFAGAGVGLGAGAVKAIIDETKGSIASELLGGIIDPVVHYGIEHIAPKLMEWDSTLNKESAERLASWLAAGMILNGYEFKHFVKYMRASDFKGLCSGARVKDLAHRKLTFSEFTRLPVKSVISGTPGAVNEILVRKSLTDSHNIPTSDTFQQHIQNAGLNMQPNIPMSSSVGNIHWSNAYTDIGFKQIVQNGVLNSQQYIPTSSSTGNANGGNGYVGNAYNHVTQGPGQSSYTHQQSAMELTIAPSGGRYAGSYSSGNTQVYVSSSSGIKKH